MFKIIPETNRSIDDLIGSGLPLIQMPHMANTTLARVLVASFGVKSIFYPWTQGFADQNQPHGIRINGRLHQVADPSVFAGYAKDEKGEFVYLKHLDVFQKVSQGNCLTYQSFLHQNRDLVMRLLEVFFLKLLPEQEKRQDKSWWWSRCVATNGTEETRTVKSFAEVLKVGVAGVTGDFGFIIPIRQTVFITTVIEAMMSGKSEVIHFGGRTFLKQLVEWQDDLDQFVEATKSITNIEQLSLRVPSLADLSFVVPAHLKLEADSLFDAFELFKKHPTHGNHRVVLCSLAAFSETFRGQMTQHDLSLRNTSVYMPDKMRSLSFKNLSLWCRDIRFLEHKLLFVRFRHFAIGS